MGIFHKFFPTPNSQNQKEMKKKSNKGENIFNPNGQSYKDSKYILGQVKEKWKDEYIGLIEEYSAMGIRSYSQLAKKFDVDPRTIQRWENSHPGFGEALQLGRDRQNQNVENSLYKLAIGFTKEIDEIHVVNREIQRVRVNKYFPPNHNSAWKWLTSQYKEKWSEVTKTETNKNIHIFKHVDMKDYSDSELKDLEVQGISKVMNDLKNQN